MEPYINNADYNPDPVDIASINRHEPPLVARSVPFSNLRLGQWAERTHLSSGSVGHVRVKSSFNDKRPICDYSFIVEVFY